MKSKSNFPLKISVFRVVRNVICSQLHTVFIIQGNGKTLFNWFVKFLRKNYANYVQNKFLLKLRRHSSLCIVRFSWFYCVSINYIYISSWCFMENSKLSASTKVRGAVNSIFYQKRFWCLQTQYRKSKKSVLPYFFSRYRNFDYSLSSVFRLLFTTIIIIIIRGTGLASNGGHTHRH